MMNHHEAIGNLFLHELKHVFHVAIVTYVCIVVSIHIGIDSYHETSLVVSN